MTSVPADLSVRVSDADRDRVAAELGDHHAAGRLDLAEFHRRLDAAYDAKTAAELRDLLADLPRPTGAPAPEARTCRPPSGPGSTWLLTGLICLVIWTATSIGSGSLLYFWPMWVIGPWGAVLLSGPVGRRLIRR